MNKKKSFGLNVNINGVFFNFLAQNVAKRIPKVD